MILVTGITGKVGGATARHLLKMGKQIRALVRDEVKAAAWAADGVELVKGEWENADALTRALDGVEGAYLMMPSVGAPSPDFSEAKTVVASYQEALAKAPPPKLVVLSSVGSEKPRGLGLITSTHLLEEGLQGMPFPVTFLRAGSFIENYLVGLQTGPGGTLPSFYAPTNRKLPMIATEDIGAEVAKRLVSNWTGTQIVELGSMTSPDDLAAALGEVLGRKVKAQAVPREAWAGALEGMGLPKGKTGAYEEMLDGVNSGWINFGDEKAERVAATTSAKDVFAAAKAAS